jgi:dihydroneopterin aldolase
MDTLYIKSFKIPTMVGVHAWEQKIKQTLVIDVAMQIELSELGDADDLTKTVDYWQAMQQIKALLQSRSFKLIETVAENIAQLLLTEFATAAVTVSVAKPSVASDVEHVAVSITRKSHA